MLGSCAQRNRPNLPFQPQDPPANDCSIANEELTPTHAQGYSAKGLLSQHCDTEGVAHRDVTTAELSRGDFSLAMTWEKRAGITPRRPIVRSLRGIGPNRVSKCRPLSSAAMSSPSHNTTVAAAHSAATFLKTLTYSTVMV
jgi:hypothetical protein